MALTKVIGSGIGTVTNQFADGNMSAGSQIQVVQTVVTAGSFTTTSTTYTDITGMTVAITPSATSSKILVIVQVSGGNESAAAYLNLLRGSTEIYKGSQGNAIGASALATRHTGGESTGNNSIIFLDSPNTTSATTYKLQVRCRNTGTFRLNLNNDGASGSGTTNAVGASSITVIEIKG